MTQKERYEALKRSIIEEQAQKEPLAHAIISVLLE